MLNSLKRRRRFVLLALAVVTVGGCAPSIPVTKTWQYAGLSGPLDFKKTMAMAFYGDPEIRQVAEDEMVKEIGSDRAVPAYSIISDPQRLDLSKVKEQLRSAGIDGVVTMKIVGSRVYDYQYVPPNSEQSFDDYYGGTEEVFQPGYFQPDKIVQIQTNIYRMADSKLVWSGVSDTFNPQDAKKVVGEVGRGVIKELRIEGLMK